MDTNIQFDLFQFADDTFMIGDGSQKNLRSIKALLRGFELVSGLRLNLSKGKIHLYNLSMEKQGVEVIIVKVEKEVVGLAEYKIIY